MKNLEKINTHNFIQNLLTDGEMISKGRKFKITNIAIEDPDFTELEFYIHKTGFYCIHLIELCQQIENALELFSNFRYSDKAKISRGDHLVYNIENYIIRLSSLNDRILQTANATFHLCIDEKDVNERVVINNLKVSRTLFPKHYSEFKTSMKEYSGERNTIIHRHSLLDKELREIQVLYPSEFMKKMLSDVSDIRNFKEVRKTILTRFINTKKKEFSSINENCFKSILPLFDDFNEQYNKVKQNLKSS